MPPLRRASGRLDRRNAALKVKLKVEHRLGEYLAETVRPRSRTGNTMLPEEVSKIESSRAQQLAELEWRKIEEAAELRLRGVGSTVEPTLPPEVSKKQSHRYQQAAAVSRPCAAAGGPLASDPALG